MNQTMTRGNQMPVPADTRSPMSDPHEAHVTRILSQFNADLRAKYEAGQSEHGGELWNKRGMLDHAIEEAIDMVVYLYTLREQLDKGMKP